jgi:hypothetical protein
MRIREVAFLLVVIGPACGGGDAGQDAAVDARGVDVNTQPPEFVINEVFAGGSAAHPSGFMYDWIEITNLGGDADIGGYSLSDQELQPGKAFIPNNTIIPAGGHLKLDVGIGDIDFQLDEDGSEGISLFARDLNLVDSATFPSGGAGTGTNLVTWGRLPDGTGQFTTLATPTPAAANQP